MKLVIQIDLGNDAMSTSDDVAEALRATARTITERDAVETASRQVAVEGTIRDLNGNRVGTWTVQP